MNRKALFALLLVGAVILAGQGMRYWNKDRTKASTSEQTEETKGVVETWGSSVLASQSQDWGLCFGASGEQPKGNVSTEELSVYDAFFMGENTEKVIYLTFDCGYENGNTPEILDALAKHEVKATFFVVGHYLNSAPELVKRMVEEGHTVGNHTFHHPDMSSISSKEKFLEELNLVRDAYKEVTGEEMCYYYRPPQGKFTKENLVMAKELGYQTFFWSLAYADWDQNNQPTEQTAMEKLTTRIHPGAVVLLHNTSSTNARILDELLTKWTEMGYTFQPLGELTGQTKE